LFQAHCQQVDRHLLRLCSTWGAPRC
jgi:hypothetical protein